MRFTSMAAIAAVATGMLVSAAAAQTVTYSDRTSFQSALSSSFTDGFGPSQGYPGVFTILSNANMTAVVGQTRYETTGFQNWNLILPQDGGFYCAGCNGSFTLHFDNTSFGGPNGVGGVGLTIRGNDNYSALVTFGDEGSQLFSLPTTLFGNNVFWGLTSNRQILSIAFGPGGQPSTGGSFAMDDLTIGTLGTGAVPEPASWAMLIAGFGLAGAAMRRRRQTVVSA